MSIENMKGETLILLMKIEDEYTKILSCKL